ncbi:MAG TPA: zinc-binding dehydrogenase [Pseudonocardiaceae bacterium]|nr:zinc-binding dehydrogenase [Pseudonocardiaceae bacterium]
MRRVVAREHGTLQVEDAPRPEPGDGELLVEVAAVGVTLPVVRLVREGPLPILPGGEVAGRIVAIGPGVTGWRIGRRAAGLAFTGAYAEFAAVAAAFLTPVPDDVDDAAAVALVRGGQVALGAARAAAVGPGESVLVTAAAGGVGHLAVQVAAALGAHRVVAAAGTDAKRAFLHGVGVAEVVRYGEPVDPVDVVLDGTGGDVQAWCLDALAPMGRLVSYSATGAPVDVNQLRLHARTVIGFAMAHFASRRPDAYRRQQGELWELYRSGALRPAVHATLPLERAADAHRVIEARANLGKVVLRAAAC